MESFKTRENKRDLGEYYYRIMNIPITPPYMNTLSRKGGEKEESSPSKSEEGPEAVGAEVGVRIINC